LLCRNSLCDDPSGNTARLEQSVAAYRAALEKRTRARVPRNWVMTQYNLANTLATLATRLQDPERMAEALACMRCAADVFRQAGHNYRLPLAEGRISKIEAQLAVLRRESIPILTGIVTPQLSLRGASSEAALAHAPSACFACICLHLR
jgi:hypothetical protein